MLDSIKFQNKWKFILPSVVGILLFMIPVHYGGQSMIVVGILVNYFQSLLKEILPSIMVIMIVIPTLISFWNKLFPIGYIEKNATLNQLFSTTFFWLMVRVLGAIFAIIALFKLGPEILWSSNTGGNILFSLLPICGMWFFVAGFLLPLLTDYGIMDFMSAIFKDFARPLFHIPGRALIDCFTSWIGSGVCGTYLTISQYETGCYTAKEAAIIITNFSIVSVSFCSAIAQHLQISSAFIQYYLTVMVAGFVCALITPRIWPISKMIDGYNPECGKTVSEAIPPNISRVDWGMQLAVERASYAPSFAGFVRKGLTTAFDLIANTAPILMAFGTIALILTEYTLIFDVMSYPFKLLLELFRVPYAAEAAPALILGFADQYLPVIVGALIPSFYTRFIIGCIAVLQIIYVTEIGAMVLTSKVPLKFWQLFVIFLERTLISLPIVIIMANVFLL